MASNKEKVCLHKVIKGVVHATVFNETSVRRNLRLGIVSFWGSYQKY